MAVASAALFSRASASGRTVLELSRLRRLRFGPECRLGCWQRIAQGPADETTMCSCLSTGR